ncbi:MAG: hypothetical protein SO172_06205 [Pararoseburia sp.]|nr:hypothetical protein [Lachnospiraceae bacterium]MDY4793745.1 hypothetical protein [Pararoseburia sp.]
MIKKRLIGLVPESKKYIVANVLFQWISLCCNVVLICTIAGVLNRLMAKETVAYGRSLLIILVAVGIRIICVKLANTASYYASKRVKRNYGYRTKENPGKRDGKPYDKNILSRKSRDKR